MIRSLDQLREDALAIWRAGVAAVDSRRLVMESLQIEGGQIIVGDDVLPIDEIGRLVVVGAGKAGAGMAAGVEAALGEPLMARLRLEGWVNVPADCVAAPHPGPLPAAGRGSKPLSRIHLHAARPASVNEPTSEGVIGSERILELVSRLGSRDVCLCLLSGGGSALLPAPLGVSLDEKLAVTRFLSAAGANIEQLNTVRKQLSRVKGGGLARACRAGRLYSLIISDVMGDPLDMIASGPTVIDTGSAHEAIAILERFGGRQQRQLANVFAALEARQAKSTAPYELADDDCQVTNLIIGNNAAAVDAAGIEAEKRGYSHAMVSARASEGPAEDVGRHLADMAISMREHRGPDCLISGGEPVVRLVPAEKRGQGGRNQQLVLAALQRLAAPHPGDGEREQTSSEGIVLLSGGTDGEDGPTDAAGAFVDAQVIASARDQGLDAAAYLSRNDAYRFFDPLGALIRTGPTNTNVGDLRVITVSRDDDTLAAPAAFAKMQGFRELESPQE